MSASSARAAKITSNGQVSLPAELRHRWATSTVLVIDRGEYAIVRPVPDDIITALRGAYARDSGPTSDEARSTERTTEAARATARARR